MQLTIDSEQLVKIGYEAMMDTLKLHHFVENTMKNYQKTLSWEKTLLDKITSKDYDFFKLSPDMKSFYERQARENEEEKRRVLEGYNDRHWELFKQAIADRNLFRDVAKVELSELENDVYSKTAGKADELTGILKVSTSQAKDIRDLSARREYAYNRETENKF
jgi:predicted nuclease with TOPRIM domain